MALSAAFSFTFFGVKNFVVILFGCSYSIRHLKVYLSKYMFGCWLEEIYHQVSEWKVTILAYVRNKRHIWKTVYHILNLFAVFSATLTSWQSENTCTSSSTFYGTSALHITVLIITFPIAIGDLYSVSLFRVYLKGNIIRKQLGQVSLGIIFWCFEYIDHYHATFGSPILCSWRYI